ncbi:hypothetical protein N7373_15025 [Achromobacter mucicolens]|uniref:hypothetical protein n=1 Tax=Achromobacter TaxID=222 RepID=UPI002446A4AD|nr:MULTISPECIES: hypothetical protein [Achromobacter]MDH0092763.1 hypothetical protein [Achromobacter mucicolens]
MARNVVDVINEQKGQLLNLQCLTSAIVRALPAEGREAVRQCLHEELEAARTMLLASPAPETVGKSFELHATSTVAYLASLP